MVSFAQWSSGMTTRETFPLVTVIIPHYNDLKRLDQCLNAVMAQTYPRDRFEVIVSDNNSPVGIEAVAAVVGDRGRVIHAPIKGAGPARNAGVKAASNEILAFTDSDCIPEKGWLEAGVKVLAGVDYVGGKVAVLTRPGITKSGAEAYECLFAFNNEKYVTQEGFSVTANMFCTKTMFQKNGDFRSDVSEDTEWGLRAKDNGFRIAFARDAVVGHPAREDWEALRKKMVRINAELYYMVIDRGGSKYKWLLRCWAMVFSIPIFALTIFTSPLLVSAERWATFTTLIRCRFLRLFESHKLVFGPDRKHA